MKGVGDREEGEKEGVWGERVRGACYKNPHLFIALTLKPQLGPTVIACLAGRDAQEVLYTGFVQTPSGDSR